MTELDPTSNEALFARFGSELADSVQAALPNWVAASVALRIGTAEAENHRAVIDEAGSHAAAEIGDRLRELLVLDVDDQWTNPLSIVRSAVEFPTAVLQKLGVAEVSRDRFAASQNPGDVYDLAPAAFADFGPEVHERGITWGAAKAHLHLQRRRAEGRRS